MENVVKQSEEVMANKNQLKDIQNVYGKSYTEKDFLASEDFLSSKHVSNPK